MMPVPHDTTDRALVYAFAPVHKLALGVAVGTATGLLLFAATMAHVLLQDRGELIGLLAQYFYGYAVSPIGAIVGLWWGFVTGFVAGWFLAFVRNFTTAVVLFALRSKAELSRTNDFLDHI